MLDVPADYQEVVGDFNSWSGDFSMAASRSENCTGKAAGAPTMWR
jgi:hypothetical protein